MSAHPARPDDPVLMLPVPERLALAYAPSARRAPILALLALDRRLAAIVAGAGEPLLAQMKLAWWRERLGEDRSRWPSGEPLLALLRCWPDDPAPLARLQPLVDGWELLLGEGLDQPTMDRFAAGRGAAWEALALALCPDAAALAARAGVEWGWADLALHLSPGAEREAALAGARACGWQPAPLPGALRPLAVLHALARRAILRSRAHLLDGPGALIAALRAGLLAR